MIQILWFIFGLLGYVVALVICVRMIREIARFQAYLRQSHEELCAWQKTNKETIAFLTKLERWFPEESNDR